MSQPMTEDMLREPVTREWIDGVRINYGLNEATPNEAARQWLELSPTKGVPVGAITALGCALNEVERLADALRVAREREAAERTIQIDTLIDIKDTVTDHRYEVAREVRGRIGEIVDEAISELRALDAARTTEGE